MKMKTRVWADPKMEADRVVRDLAKVAFANIADFVQFEGNRIIEVDHVKARDVGAKVKIGKQWVYATTSGSYLSASDGQVHFGLGSDKEATVEIVWPSGAKQVLEKIAADRIVTVKEPE